MAERRNPDDDAIRAIAEKATPGWKAVDVGRGLQPVDSNGPSSDFQGLDLSSMRGKYFGVAVDGPPKAAPKSNDDARFVTMTPATRSDSPIQTRKVIVSGKKVVGFEG